MKKNMNTKKHATQLEIGTFIVNLPKKYKPIWTDLYTLQVGNRTHALYQDQNDPNIRPRDPNLKLDSYIMSMAKRESRSYRVQIGGIEILISGAYYEDGDYEAYKDQLFDAKNGRGEVIDLEINGFKGFCAISHYKDHYLRNWCFKKDFTVLSISARNTAEFSRADEDDIAWIIEHIE